jgi:hypothetical protein
MVPIHGYRRLYARARVAALQKTRKIQVDNGTEFPLAFALSCQHLEWRRHVQPE